MRKKFSEKSSKEECDEDDETKEVALEDEGNMIEHEPEEKEEKKDDFL